jgi:GNAT superfamily N-acetyltransferase
VISTSATPQPVPPHWSTVVQRPYVVPEAWGTGAATGLLGDALGAVDRAGHAAVWLAVVEGLARARRFYEREGWRLDDDVPPATNGLVTLLHDRFDR